MSSKTKNDSSLVLHLLLYLAYLLKDVHALDFWSDFDLKIPYYDTTQLLLLN